MFWVVYNVDCIVKRYGWFCRENDFFGGCVIFMLFYCKFMFLWDMMNCVLRFEGVSLD